MKKRLLIALTGMLFITSLPAQQITRAEYYFNTDPGQGLATSLPVTAGDSVVINNSITIPAGLQQGINILYVRACDNQGVWSLSESSLLWVNSAGKKITAFEYFFDTDPGFGSGTKTSFAPVDSTVITQNIILPGSLHPGLHLLFTRAQNEQGVWGLSEVYLISVQNGLQKLTGAEYFFDTDPGMGAATPIIFPSPADSINMVQGIPVPALAMGTHILYIRSKDQSGTWGFAEAHAIHICTAYGPTSAFSDYINGPDVYFTDSSSLATSRSWNFGDNTGEDTTVNPHHIFQEGNIYPVRLRTFNSCGIDTVITNISIFGVQSISPNKAPATGIYIGYVKGAGFLPGTTTRLLKAGNINIPADTTIYVNPGLLKVIFRNQNETTGMYDLLVAVPGHPEKTLVNAVSIEPPVPMDIWTNLVGRRAMVFNRWTTFRIVYGNNGNTTAIGIPIWISVPGNVSAKLITRTNDSTIQSSLLDIIHDQFFLYKDSVTGDSSRNCFLLMPYIEPGKTGEIIFDLKSSLSNSYFKIAVQAGNGFFADSNMNIGGKTTQYCAFPACMQCIVDLITSTPGIPSLISCPFSAMAALCDIANTLDGDGPSNGAKAVSIAGSIASAILSCTPLNALQLVSNMAKINWGKVGLFAAGMGASSLPGAGSIVGDCGACYKDPKLDSIKVVFSMDPNVKTGPIGYNTLKYTRWQDPFNYSIDFENIASATAPASKVFVTDYLDTSKLDMSSFRFTGFGFADTSFNFTESDSLFIQDVDLRPAKQAIVRFRGSLDSLNKLSFSFTTLDPATMNLTTDISQGFLNPDVDGQEGLGFVTFQVRVKPDLATGTTINNMASIAFDANAPINTAVWLNSIDKEKPSSHVLPITEKLNDTTYIVRWTGLDAHAGLYFYRIMVSDNDSAYKEWVKTDTLSATFIAKLSHTYKFYSVAQDWVGNIEDPPGTPDQILTVSLPVTLLEFNAYKQNKTVLLRWITSFEQNNRGFEIQRSSNGVSFSRIGWVDGANNSSSQHTYVFTDSTPLNGKNFYRLNQLDIDNHSKLSEVRKVDFEQLVDFSLYPNPATTVLNVQLSNNITTIKITDMQGRLLHQENTNGALQVLVPIQQLPDGVYLMDVSDRNGNHRLQKFIKTSH